MNHVPKYTKYDIDLMRDTTLKYMTCSPDNHKEFSKQVDIPLTTLKEWAQDFEEAGYHESIISPIEFNKKLGHYRFAKKMAEDSNTTINVIKESIKHYVDNKNHKEDSTIRHWRDEYIRAGVLKFLRRPDYKPSKYYDLDVMKEATLRHILCAHSMSSRQQWWSKHFGVPLIILDVWKEDFMQGGKEALSPVGRHNDDLEIIRPLVKGAIMCISRDMDKKTIVTKRSMKEFANNFHISLEEMYKWGDIFIDGGVKKLVVRPEYSHS